MPPGCLPLEGLLDLEHPGDILRPIWLEDFPKRSWKTLLGRGTSGLPCSGCCYCDLDKWQKMDGWMVERVKVRNVMVPNWPCNLKTCRPPVHHSPPPSVNESSKNRAVLRVRLYSTEVANFKIGMLKQYESQKFGSESKFFCCTVDQTAISSHCCSNHIVTVFSIKTTLSHQGYLDML